jgi:hypothetical protein
VADSKKDKYKTNEADETAIHLNKWVMPTPQLQAYIKCPRYDFL